MKTMTYLCALASAGYLTMASAASADPVRPPIQKPITIYTEGREYPLLEETDITDVNAYKQFPDNYPNGSRILRMPVQVWPKPTATSTQSTIVLNDKSGYNVQGWPLPDVSKHAYLGYMEGELCPGKIMHVDSFESNGEIVNIYSKNRKNVAFSKNDTVFVSKNGGDKFTHSANEMNLCDFL